MALGLTDDEFYALTPRQYQLLLDRHEERERHSEWMFGVLAATVANFSQGAPEKALQPKDFPFLRLRDQEPATRNRRPQRQMVADKLRMFFTRKMAANGQ